MKGSVSSGVMWPQRFVIILEALLILRIKDGIIDMSFIGKSVIHLFCDDAHVTDIKKRLQDAGHLLVDFDPLEIPDLVIASTESKTEREREGRENVIKRLGAMYHRGGLQFKQAWLHGVPEDLATAICHHAATYAAPNVSDTHPTMKTIDLSPNPKPFSNALPKPYTRRVPPQPTVSAALKTWMI
ncbi:hypothetical protein BC829DRAFT_424204 [Chytridium lagenaria]|nr:hypothetical protein BC829DRAFT_424204 [Chytridium lagenaria]